MKSSIKFLFVSHLLFRNRPSIVDVKSAQSNLLFTLIIIMFTHSLFLSLSLTLSLSLSFFLSLSLSVSLFLFHSFSLSFSLLSLSLSLSIYLSISLSLCMPPTNQCHYPPPPSNLGRFGDVHLLRL